MKSKNEQVLKDFVKYCEANPEQRFWQALRNWSKYIFIIGYKSTKSKDNFPYIEDTDEEEDTFYKEGK